jgi:asparagine synthase (glutamine-hydrolysing)
MCGVSGVYSKDIQQAVEPSVITMMANELIHRGPDDSACYVNGHVGLGFRRLSIVDVLHGRQPFVNNEKSVTLICNGEIYNYRELRSELEARGCRFNTNCDVEVILHLYCEYGVEMVSRLNGQFAFAIFDQRNNSLFLARDQFGICPLFYTEVDGLFIFASEIKAILKHPSVKRIVDVEGLDQILTFPGLVSPVTMFKGIKSLAPGHHITVTRDSTKLVQYWDLIYPENPVTVFGSESDYVEKLESLLLASVSRRLTADVPIGFYLSGGLDSSLIGALMKTINPACNYPSFSIELPQDPEMNEVFYQKEVIKHLNLVHTSIPFNYHDIAKRLRQAVWTSESALKETYNTCSLALSECVKNNGVKVILSGEGADELFGGYVGYRFDKQRAENFQHKDLEELLEDECRKNLWGDSDFFYEKNYHQFSDTKRSLYSRKLREGFKEFDSVKKVAFNKDRIKNRHLLHKRSYVDLKFRLSDHLISDHCDRVTYANSVEGRFPFLDVELVDYVKSIPPDIKLKGLVEKYILKKVALKYIPESIVNRQKFGFVAPGSPDLLKSNTDWITDLLSYERIKRQGYFDPDVIESLKKTYSKEQFKLNLPFDSDLLIVVLTFNLLLELFELPDFG